MQISILNGILTEINETLTPTSSHALPININVTGGVSSFNYDNTTGNIVLQSLSADTPITVTAASYNVTYSLTGCINELPQQGISGSFSRTIYAKQGYYISTAMVSPSMGTVTISADKKTVTITIQEITADFTITVEALEIERHAIVMHPNNNGTEDRSKILLPKATEDIIVGDKIRALYVNQRIGTTRLNAALESLANYGTSGTDCYTQPYPLGGNSADCKFSLLRGDVYANNDNEEEYNLICILDINKLGKAMSQGQLTSCTGYLICYTPYAGVPKPIYMSDWNTANDYLIAAAEQMGFNLGIDGAGWYTDYIDFPVDYFGASASPTYDAYVKVTSKNSDNVQGNIGSFDLFDELFTKTPSTFDGQFVTKDYVDSLIISALNTAI